MAQYRLILALPQSLPGNTEMHYGRLCEIRNDGVWAELNEIEATAFLRGRKIHGPIIPDEVKEEVKEEKEPKTKRGPKASPKAETPAAKFDTPIDDELRRLAEEL